MLAGSHFRLIPWDAPGGVIGSGILFLAGVALVPFLMLRLARKDHEGLAIFLGLICCLFIASGSHVLFS
jgi:hypothetical protein